MFNLYKINSELNSNIRQEELTLEAFQNHVIKIN